MGTHYASTALADMNEPSQPFQASREGPKSLGSQYFSTPHPTSGHDYQPESSFKIQLWPVFGPVGPCPHCVLGMAAVQWQWQEVLEGKAFPGQRRGCHRVRTRRPLVASSYSTSALPFQAPTLLPTQEASCLKVGIKTGTREGWRGPPWGPGGLGSSESHHRKLKTRLTVRMMPRRRTKGSQVFTKAPTLMGEHRGMVR